MCAHTNTRTRAYIDTYAYIHTSIHTCIGYYRDVCCHKEVLPLGMPKQVPAHNFFHGAAVFFHEFHPLIPNRINGFTCFFR